MPPIRRARAFLHIPDSGLVRRGADKLYLLPVQGSDTQWYKNVLENPTISIDARGAEAELKAVPITDKKQVSAIVERFREKYGAGDVKKYYSKFDAAVVVQMR